MGLAQKCFTAAHSPPPWLRKNTLCAIFQSGFAARAIGADDPRSKLLKRHPAGKACSRMLVAVDGPLVNR